MQEAITLIVFTLFVVLATKEKMRTTDYIAMGLISRGRRREHARPARRL